MASSPATAAPPSASYWCYSYNRFVHAALQEDSAIACLDCGGGFLDEMGAPPPRAAYLCRTRRTAIGGDRSPFNPVVVLRCSPAAGKDDSLAAASSFELFYDDGAGSGLCPLPDSMSDFLMGSGFERLLDQLTQIEAGGLTVTIAISHIGTDSHYAVCKEPFELDAEAREIPCNPIYH